MPREAGSAVARRRRRAVALLGALAVTVAGATLASTRIMSPAELVASATPPAPRPITAPVERRVIAASIVVRGRVAAETAHEVAVTAPDTVAVVTAAPKTTGDRVAEGDVVLAVNGRPIVALAGALPAYRDLRPGATGDDVAQLQAALSRLGHEIDDDPGTYGPSTERAVARLYAVAGYEAPTGGDEGIAAAAAARRDVAAAEQQVGEARAARDRASAPVPASVRLQAEEAVAAAERGVRSATVGGDADVAAAEAALAAAVRERDRLDGDPAAPAEARMAAEAAVADATTAVTRAGLQRDDAVAAAEAQLRLAVVQLEETLAPPDTSAESAALASAQSALDDAAAALAAATAANGAVLPQREVLWVSTLPGTVSQAAVAVGQALERQDGEAPPALVVTAGAVVVRTSVSAAEREVVRRGAPVVAEVDAGDARIEGTVASVGDDRRVGDDGVEGYEVVVEPDEPVDPALLGTDLRVSIATATSGAAVLAVPLAAVSATGDGGHRVTVVGRGAPRDVAVVPGLAAGGFVEVRPRTGGSLRPGDLVVVGR